MHRRTFVRLLAATPALAQAKAGEALTPQTTPRGSDTLPKLKVVSRYSAAPTPGMPGPYPGRVVSVTSDKCVDIGTGAAHEPTVREMLAQGMRALTGAPTTADA